MAGPSGAARDTELVVPAGSSDDSSDSYSGDDVCHYLREQNAVMDHYSEATREGYHLEVALNASQATLAAVEGETNVV